MTEQKNQGKYTQNYPTERKDYDERHREPAEGDEETVDKAVESQSVQPEPEKKPSVESEGEAA